jgi:hypothetical protein
MLAPLPPIILGDGPGLARDDGAIPAVRRDPIRKLARSDLVFMS